MIISEKYIKCDGTVEDREIEVPDGYFDAPEIPPTPDDDRDAMLVDLEYRLTLIELGVM